MSESRDADRPRSIDFAGSVLVALTLTPIILALSKGSDWGWTSLATLGCLALAVVSGFAFVAVEKRVAVPMLDLALLRNRVLVASTIAILIGAGTINALMYLVSLYFQDPSTLGLSSLQAGLATLPATAGLVAVAPLVPRVAARFGGRQVVGAGFAITAAGSPRSASWTARGGTARSSCPWSPSPSGWGSPTGRPHRPRRHRSRRTRWGRPPASPTWPATSARPWRRRSPRPSTATSSQTGPPRAQSTADALSSGLATASWAMAVFSLAGVLMAVVMGRHRVAQGTLADSGAAAAAHLHTLPTSATPSGPSDRAVRDV